MFNPSRNQIRLFFIEAWKKYTSKQMLSDLENIALTWMLEHPEFLKYYDEQFIDKDFAVESGQTNPFLHLSMHLAIEEQIRSNQPPGIQQAFETLSSKFNSNHEAAHALFDCLAEQIYQNQTYQTEFSSTAYLLCIQEKIKKS